MSLEQVLTGAPENPPPVEQPADSPQTLEPPVDPPKGEEPPAAPPAAKPEKTVPLAALEDERRKRQELEQRLAQQQPPQQPKPGFWEKPEEHLAELRNFAATQALATRLDTSEMIARSRYQDYDAQLESFGKLVEKNPALRLQMLQSANPAEFAYSTAKNHATFEQAGSVEKLREQIRAEERAKLEAEAKAKADAEAKKREALPNTLTDVQGGAPRTAEFTGPTPLADIIK